MAVTTTRKVTAAGKEFERRIKELKDKPHVDIGFPEVTGGKAKDDAPSLTVADVATFHEFGTEPGPKHPGITERSFIRSNDKENEAKYKKILDELRYKVIFLQTPAKDALAILGEVIQNDVKARIVAGIAPELSPKTIKAKGSSTPLIDSGQLINSVRYQVFEKGKGK